MVDVRGPASRDLLVERPRVVTDRAAQGTDPGPIASGCPLRVPMLGIEAVMATASAAGAVQLAIGVGTPPVGSLPFGLTSWVLPGLWLFVSVCVPSAVVTWLLFRRDRRAPVAVVAACGALGVELVTQIPFVGYSWLQAGCGGLGGAAALAAVTARRRGWRTRPRNAEASGGGA